MADWKTVRRTIGVVHGRSADAVEDTARLHDEDGRWSEAVYRANLRTLVWIGSFPNVQRGCALVRAMQAGLERERRKMTMEREAGWKEEIRRVLAKVGRPYVIVVYDTPVQMGDEWGVTKEVPYWVRSTVTPADIGTVVDHIRTVTGTEMMRRMEVLKGAAEET